MEEFEEAVRVSFHVLATFGQATGGGDRAYGPGFIPRHNPAEKQASQSEPVGPAGPAGPQGPAGTARAFALVTATGTVTRGSNVLSVTHTANSGEYCVEPAGSVPSAQTGAVVSPYYPTDSTTTAGTGITTQVEYDGTCGVNGEEVFTFKVTNGATVAFTDEPFFVAVP